MQHRPRNDGVVIHKRCLSIQHFPRSIAFVLVSDLIHRQQGLSDQTRSGSRGTAVPSSCSHTAAAPSRLVSFRGRPEQRRRPRISGCLISRSKAQQLRILSLGDDSCNHRPHHRPLSGRPGLSISLPLRKLPALARPLFL